MTKTLSAIAICSSLTLLTACGGGGGINVVGSDSGANTCTNISSDDFGTIYDLGEYVLAQQTGTFTRNTYREENGAVTLLGDEVNLQIDAPMQAGEWIEDEVGFSEDLYISAYRINAETIDLKVSVLGIDQELSLKRFVSIGENAVGADAPFSDTLILKGHYNQFCTVMNGTTQRTDTDVITLETSIEAYSDVLEIGLNTTLDINLSRDLGVVSGIDRDCVTTTNIFGLEVETGVDDDLPDSQCSSIRTDYLILDPQVIRR